MKIALVSIIIERDPMTKIPKHAYPWEVPVYRAQYGDEKVEILNTEKPIYGDIDELPDPTEEYMRLRQQFGIEPDTKQSHADIVYGRGQDGIDNLEKAMKKSSVSDTAKKVDIESAIEHAQAVVDGGEADPDRAEARAAAYKDPLSEDNVMNQKNGDAVIGKGIARPRQDEPTVPVADAALAKAAANLVQTAVTSVGKAETAKTDDNSKK